VELTTDQINQLVFQFNQANHDRKEPLASETFQQIESATHKIRERLIASYEKTLGFEARDIAVDCLLKSCLNFKPIESASFYAFYKTVAINKLNGAYKQRKNRMESDDVSKAFYVASDYSEQLAAYRIRKRKILDGIRFKSDGCLATLLLLQRHRLASILQKNQTFAFQGNRSEFIDNTEIWYHQEYQLELKRSSNCRTNNIWNAYAQVIDLDAEPVQYQIMVAAIGAAGLKITIDNWRKMASRALQFIRDQLDEEERGLFDV